MQHHPWSIPITSPYLGKNQFLRSDGKPFWRFLETSGIAYQKNHFPFLTPGTIPQVKAVFDFDEYVRIQSFGEALAYLYRGLGHALNYVGPVLDLELPHGFNDHTDRHTLWVSIVGMELLRRAGLAFNGQGYYDEKTEVLMTLAGLTHDLGNFMGRAEHPMYSAWLLHRLFAHHAAHPQEWDAVMYAIMFHDSEIIRDLQVEVKAGMPLQWALILADKMHVSRDRIGGRSIESGIERRAFENDVHILLNSMIVRSSWFLGVECFVWHLDFSIDQLQQKFKAFTKGNGRLWVPASIQRRFLKNGKKYRESFCERFAQIYGSRIKMAAECAFLLFPQINTFEVRLSDTDTRGKVESGEVLVWQTGRG